MITNKPTEIVALTPLEVEVLILTLEFVIRLGADFSKPQTNAELTPILLKLKEKQNG